MIHFNLEKRVFLKYGDFIYQGFFCEDTNDEWGKYLNIEFCVEASLLYSPSNWLSLLDNKMPIANWVHRDLRIYLNKISVFKKYSFFKIKMNHIENLLLSCKY